ncbi:creatininase family protein [Halococcus hamelinensis]|uniref:Creatininase n=1 Tax=Halococcus hamelinensis 100A6 TaxID=1132509 RepID=M0M197_9EURY|nr:creatininase family protein [Halococcus hamelinensis]EMA38160.1 hypothetical protein C447_10545 [Halococcus hamelinensis 100A6]
MEHHWVGEPAVSWAAMTYANVLDVAERDGSILVVPTGSLEQHGFHLPTATDSILVNAVAQEGATRTSETVPVVVTPPIWTGRSPHHLSLGGTVSLDTRGLLETLRQVAETALRNGFDALVFLNGHGGNASVVTDAVSEVGTAHPSVEVLGLTYFSLAADVVDGIRDSPTGGVSHGGEFETSLMLHVCPELVREDRITGTRRDEPYDAARQDLFVDGPLAVHREFDEYSDSGAVGDPEQASDSKGRELYDHIAANLGDLLTVIHDQNEARSN